MTQIIDSQNFELTVKDNNVVLVDFYADWCGPCQALLPTLENISDQYKDQAVIAKVNVDKNPELSRLFQVRSIPALFYFKNGKVVDKQVGLQSKSSISETINKLLKNN